MHPILNISFLFLLFVEYTNCLKFTNSSSYENIKNTSQTFSPFERQSGLGLSNQGMSKDVKRIVPVTSSTNKIAFMALLSNTITNPAPGHVVIFDKETVDISNNYNSNTGYFTAPVSGTYYFNLAVSSPPSQGDHHLWVDIMKDGVEAGYLFLDTHAQYWLKRTESVLLHLEAGDNVYVQVTKGDGQHVIAGVDSWGHYHHTHFSGFLITAD